MRPASGASKPAMSRSSVDLPEPDGPTTAVRLPAGTLEVDAGKRDDGAEDFDTPSTLSRLIARRAARDWAWSRR